MRRFVDEIVVNDYELMCDIVHALESKPVRDETSTIMAVHKNYEVEMYDQSGHFDMNRNKHSDSRFVLKIFVKD